MHPPRGFTLIELLVAAFIIGVLAAIVLASVNSARTKSKDIAIKTDLSTIQKEAILYYTIGKTYGASNKGASASCSASATVFNDSSSDIAATIARTIAAAVTDARANSIDVACRSITSEFIVTAKLSGGTYWCIDSHGVQKDVGTTKPAGTTLCPP